MFKNYQIKVLNEFKLDIVITTSEMYKTWNLCNLNVQNMKPVQNCTQSQRI